MKERAAVKEKAIKEKVEGKVVVLTNIETTDGIQIETKNVPKI